MPWKTEFINGYPVRTSSLTESLGEITDEQADNLRRIFGANPRKQGRRKGGRGVERDGVSHGKGRGGR